VRVADAEPGQGQRRAGQGRAGSTTVPYLGRGVGEEGEHGGEVLLQDEARDRRVRVGVHGAEHPAPHGRRGRAAEPALRQGLNRQRRGEVQNEDGHDQDYEAGRNSRARLSPSWRRRSRGAPLRRPSCRAATAAASRAPSVTHGISTEAHRCEWRDQAVLMQTGEKSGTSENAAAAASAAPAPNPARAPRSSRASRPLRCASSMRRGQPVNTPHSACAARACTYHTMWGPQAWMSGETARPS